MFKWLKVKTTYRYAQYLIGYKCVCGRCGPLRPGQTVGECCPDCGELTDNIKKIVGRNLYRRVDVLWTYQEHLIRFIPKGEEPPEGWSTVHSEYCSMDRCSEYCPKKRFELTGQWILE